MALSRFERFRRAVMVLHEEDYAPPTIAGILNVTPAAVRSAIKRTQEGSAPADPRNARAARVLRLFRQGYDTVDIAERIGVTEATAVRRLKWARDHELRLKPHQEQRSAA